MASATDFHLYSSTKMSSLMAIHWLTVKV